YRVVVTVRERLSDAVQMELGPFARRIGITSDALPEEEFLLLTGAVRGDIMVGSEEDRGKIDLRSFPTRKGATKRVLVTTEVPDLDAKRDQVRIGRERLGYLKVSLNPLPRVEGKPRWELIVQVPPGSEAGRPPDHAAILLQIPSNPPRHVRVPLAWLAY